MNGCEGRVRLARPAPLPKQGIEAVVGVTYGVSHCNNTPEGPPVLCCRDQTPGEEVKHRVVDVVRGAVPHDVHVFTLGEHTCSTYSKSEV